MEPNETRESGAGSAGIGPRGIGGWLLFLCISWTILFPTLTLVVVGMTLRDLLALRPYASQFPLLFPALTVDAALGVLVAALSVVAGLRLWRIAPNAVLTAQRYLLALGVYQVVSAILNHIALPADLTDGTASDTVTGVIRSLVWMAIWLAYFHKSQRVAATYGPARVPPNAGY